MCAHAATRLGCGALTFLADSRAKWTLLGYFYQNDCSVIGDLATAATRQQKKLSLDYTHCDRTACAAGATWSKEGMVPCSKCTAAATCKHGVQATCNTTADMLCVTATTTTTTTVTNTTTTTMTVTTVTTTTTTTTTMTQCTLPTITNGKWKSTAGSGSKKKDGDALPGPAHIECDEFFHPTGATSFTCACGSDGTPCQAVYNACVANGCTAPGVSHGSYDTSGGWSAHGNGQVLDYAKVVCTDSGWKRKDPGPTITCSCPRDGEACGALFSACERVTTTTTTTTTPTTTTDFRVPAAKSTLADGTGPFSTTGQFTTLTVNMTATTTTTTTTATTTTTTTMVTAGSSSARVTASTTAPSTGSRGVAPLPTSVDASTAPTPTHALAAATAAATTADSRAPSNIGMSSTTAMAVASPSPSRLSTTATTRLTTTVANADADEASRDGSTEHDGAVVGVVVGVVVLAIILAGVAYIRVGRGSLLPGCVTSGTPPHANAQQQSARVTHNNPMYEASGVGGGSVDLDIDPDSFGQNDL